MICPERCLCRAQWSLATAVPIQFFGGSIVPMISVEQDITCLQRFHCDVIRLTPESCTELLQFAQRAQADLVSIPFTTETSAVYHVPAAVDVPVQTDDGQESPLPIVSVFPYCDIDAEFLEYVDSCCASRRYLCSCSILTRGMLSCCLVVC
jgi:hypothetical protein